MSQTPNPQTLTTTENMKKALHLLRFAKGVDEAAFRDLEPMESVVEPGNKHGVPSAAELGISGQGIGMHGFAAHPMVQQHGTMAPQSGLMQDYTQIANMFADMAKSIQQLTKSQNDIRAVLNGHSAFVKNFQETVVKAEEENKKEEEEKKKEEMKKAEEDKKSEDEKKKKEEKDEVGKALRKARMAIQKADTVDEEDEDMDCAFGKAAEMLKALDTAITKAEDDVEDDEAETKMKKARTDYKELRTKYTTLLKKANKQPPTQTTEAVNQAALSELQKSVNDLAKMGNMTPQQVITFLTQNAASSTQGNVVSMVPKTPPAFAKALDVLSGASVVMKATLEAPARGLTDVDLARVETLASRLDLARAGGYNVQALSDEIQKSEPRVRELFAVA